MAWSLQPCPLQTYKRVMPSAGKEVTAALASFIVTFVIWRQHITVLVWWPWTSQKRLMCSGQVVKIRVILQWRHNEHDGVLNHQPHDCLLKRLIRKNQNSASLAFERGIHWWPVTGKCFHLMTSSYTRWAWTERPPSCNNILQYIVIHISQRFVHKSSVDNNLSLV